MNPLLVIEPNLRDPSGHYAEFVRAVGARAGGEAIEVFAHPDADTMLGAMPGVRVCTGEPRVGRPFAEWQTTFRAVERDIPFLVLTADGRHAAAVSAAGLLSGRRPGNARLFFHRPQALGGTSVTVRNRARTLTGTAPVSVEAEFRPEKVPPMTVKVALVMQDPLLPNSMRLHEEFRWRDPWILSNDLVRHFREATDSVVNFQIVEAVWAETRFTHYYDHMIGVSEYVNLLREPNWTSLKNAAAAGQIWFDYRMFVKHYQYDLKRNSGAIDEVWVFSAPYLGMYESQLMGPNAFYWNSPPIKDGTALTKLLSD